MHGFEGPGLLCPDIAHCLWWVGILIKTCMALDDEYTETFVRALMSVCEFVHVRASASAGVCVIKYLLSDAKPQS